MTQHLRARSAEKVFDDHLRLAGEHRFDEDVERNISPDCIVLERRGVFRGHDGVRELASSASTRCASWITRCRLAAGMTTAPLVSA